MRKRLFIYITVMIAAGLVSFFLLSASVIYTNNINLSKDTIMETAKICAGLYNDDTDISAFVQAGNNTRITIIASDGTVIADSRPLDLSAAETHLNRPEIQAALNGSPAVYRRYSDSLGVYFIYYALKVETNSGYVFIRTAIPVANIETYFHQSLPLLMFLLIAVGLLCFAFTHGMIVRITKPFSSVEYKLRLLANGEYISEPIAGSYEEINKITREIDEIALILQNSFDSLRDEKEKNVTESRENAKRREEFFANASHELKTPLTAIKGFNELTAINNKDENISKYIDSITRETDRMLTLIGDMLKLSELESAQEINPVPVSLAAVVNEVSDTMSTAINEKSIIFETFGDDCMVTAEQGHIYELVKNLIENAVRYNNHGGRVLVVIESDKNLVRLTVADNGISIPHEEQARIFERFYRVEKSRSQRSGGTGLGLSIVKHICALYGWKVSLKSKPGVGTEITVLFENNKERVTE